MTHRKTVRCVDTHFKTRTGVCALLKYKANKTWGGKKQLIK